MRTIITNFNSIICTLLLIISANISSIFCQTPGCSNAYPGFVSCGTTIGETAAFCCHNPELTHNEYTDIGRKNASASTVFIRIRRNVIVNQSKIKRFTKKTLILENDKEFPISRLYKEDIERLIA